MARAQGKTSQVATAQRRQQRDAAPAKRLGTSEARANFSKLVGELAEHQRPSTTLAENAIEIGRHRKGGAWLVPEVDAQAAIGRITELEEELENIAIGFLVEQRLEESSRTTSAADVVRELGFEDLLEGLPDGLRS